ncbi:hypothetical protein IWW43_005310 [Coemansia sp. RSA 1935]|nr:hypothetical protein IWW43_005310 [Coemansia sp. RSA 1935]
MAMIEPCMRFNPNCAYDYNIKNLIPYKGSHFKINFPWPNSMASWTAGKSITVKFQTGGADHGNEHFQFAISLGV